MVDENACTAGKLHALNLHVTVAEDSIRRWPNDPELTCVSCWVLRSVVDPSGLVATGTASAGSREGATDKDNFGENANIVSYENASAAGETRGSSLSVENTIDGNNSTRFMPENADRNSRSAWPKRKNNGIGGGSTGNDEGVLVVGDDATSDVLISLDDASESNNVSEEGSYPGPTDANSAIDLPSSTTRMSRDIVPIFPQREKLQSLPSRDAIGANSPAQELLGDQEGHPHPAVFEGEQDETVLERMLKLAEATKVMSPLGGWG